MRAVTRFACIMAFALMLALVLPVYSIGAAETLYVKGNIVIGLRNSPSDKAQTLEYIRTGDRLNVIAEEGEFLYVQTSTGREGWVLKRYAVAEEPAAARINTLRNNNELLRAKLEQLETSASETAGQLQAARVEAERHKSSLTKARKDYNDLAEMSQHVQNIATERDLLKIQIRKLRDEGSIFLQLRDTFGNTGFLLWFLAGGGVMLAGWMLGRSSRRDRY